MNAAERRRLAEAVQTNCHIADARHAADMPLCTYLLQMREFFRWERGLAFDAALPRDAIGAWIAERESLWSSLQARPFVALPAGAGATDLDAFAVRAINQRLRPDGLLYGAGMVGTGRPVFFLAELHGESRREGLKLLSAGRELARGVVAPLAALGGAEGGAVVLRRESLARWCWEKFEAFTLRRTEGSALHAMVDAYGFDGGFEAALPRWLDEQSETMLLHEIGEHRAGRRLGPAWTAMRQALPTRRGELYARAVRDHLADFGVTLPTLLDRGATGPIHFWFANFEGVREALFPSLKHAYAAWRRGDGGHALRRACDSGALHFERLARSALELHETEGDHAGAAIELAFTAAPAVCPA
jgi:hypothetical protein